MKNHQHRQTHMLHSHKTKQSMQQELRSKQLNVDHVYELIFSLNLVEIFRNYDFFCCLHYPSNNCIWCLVKIKAKVSYVRVLLVVLPSQDFLLVWKSWLQCLSNTCWVLNLQPWILQKWIVFKRWLNGCCAWPILATVRIWYRLRQ